jgi:uncharacterized protein (DUF433 family)
VANESGFVPFEGVVLPICLSLRSDGAVVFRGRRIQLYLVLEQLERGRSPAEISETFPTVMETEVAQALDFCRQHPIATKAYSDHWQAMCAEAERKASPAPTLEELRARRHAAQKLA